MRKRAILTNVISQIECFKHLERRRCLDFANDLGILVSKVPILPPLLAVPDSKAVERAHVGYRDFDVATVCQFHDSPVSVDLCASKCIINASKRI